MIIKFKNNVSNGFVEENNKQSKIINIYYGILWLNAELI